MKSLVGLSLMLIAVNGALLGTNKCSNGPDYWCASLQNAQQCATTDHCLNNEWKNLKPKSTNMDWVSENTACTFCKDMIGDIKKMITDNATISQVRQYLGKACSFMPDQFSRDECNKISEHYLDEYLALVNSTIDPESICELVRLCGNSSVAAKKQPAKLGDEDLCTDCKDGIVAAKAVLQNEEIKAQIKQAIENACKKMSILIEHECESLVDKNFDKVVAEVIAQLNDGLCVKVKLCSSLSTSVDVAAIIKAAVAEVVQKSNLMGSLKKDISVISTAVSADPCVLCEEVVNYVKLFVSNNATGDEVKSLLERYVCSQLGELSSVCKEAVDQYFPQLWQEFLSVLDPNTLCSDLKLCNATTTVAVKKTPVVPEARASVGCVICEFVMEKLESKLVSNATEAEVKEAVEKVCSYLPSTIGKECDELIEKYGDAIVHLLLQEAAPRTICSLLGLCGVSEGVKESADFCTECKNAMSYVHDTLNSNDTVQQVTSTLEKICNLLPAQMAQQCNAKVDQVVPQVLHTLAAQIDAVKICTELGLCTGKAGKLPTFKLSANECQLCKMAITYAKSMLTKQSTVQEVTKTVEKLCSELPGQTAQECNAMVEKGVPQLLQTLASFMDGDKICTSVKLCTPAADGLVHLYNRDLNI